jgi:hypothetical protein
LRIIIVITTDKPTSNMVNSKYFPSRGKASDVEGIISDMSKKNMVCDSKIEMLSAIFSPESAGK